MTRQEAILLLGPTGAGKTPLGELVEARGLAGRRCLHFDFGENLRQIADGKAAETPLDQEELEIVKASLRTGDLLADEHFEIARKILLSFLRRHGAGCKDLVILNGLPRHVGQAEAMAQMIDVRMVVRLSCSDRAIIERIRLDAGGDRAGRIDDDTESVRRRLAVFRRRTALLAAYYAERGPKTIKIEVTATTTPAEAWEALAARASRDWAPDEGSRHAGNG